MTNKPMISGDDGAFVLPDFTGDNLDPAPLVSLIPLTPVRPKRKGDALGPAIGGSARTAKTGYCGFTTAGNGLLPTGDAHLEFILKSLADHVVAMRKIMSAGRPTLAGWSVTENLGIRHRTATAISWNNRAGNDPPCTAFIGASLSLPSHAPMISPSIQPMNQASR